MVTVDGFLSAEQCDALVTAARDSSEMKAGQGGCGLHRLHRGWGESLELPYTRGSDSLSISLYLSLSHTRSPGPEPKPGAS